jgi:DNA (cytosine-5)-methyltransferase 1
VTYRLLDLFCGAGGAAKGYHDAGFEVVGVDIDPQPNYPYKFHQADVLAMDPWVLRSFDAVHASPPCQGYSTQTQHRARHPRLIEATRDLLRAWGAPYVIENVEGARAFLKDPVRLCGSSFGLDVRRHRYFETNWDLVTPPCDHGWQTPRFRSLAIANHRAGKLASVVGVHGHLNYPGEFPIRCKAMGIDWMTNNELVESIPPAYTEYIGQQLVNRLEGRQ